MQVWLLLRERSAASVGVHCSNRTGFSRFWLLLCLMPKKLTERARYAIVVCGDSTRSSSLAGILWIVQPLRNILLAALRVWGLILLIWIYLSIEYIINSSVKYILLCRKYLTTVRYSFRISCYSSSNRNRNDERRRYIMKLVNNWS